jgi:hypothetical protein
MEVRQRARLCVHVAIGGGTVRRFLTPLPVVDLSHFLIAIVMPETDLAVRCQHKWKPFPEMSNRR